MRYLIFLVWLPMLAFAQIYETLAPDGSRVFSDTASPEASLVPLSSENINVLNFNASSVTNTTAQQAPSSHAFYTQLEIHAKEDQTSIQNQTPIELEVFVQPNLAPKDRLQLWLDDQPYGSAQSSTHFTLSLERGTHHVKAQIIGADGQALLTSKALTLYKHQTSELLN